MFPSPIEIESAGGQPSILWASHRFGIVCMFAVVGVMIRKTIKTAGSEINEGLLTLKILASHLQVVAMTATPSALYKQLSHGVRPFIMT